MQPALARGPSPFANPIVAATVALGSLMLIVGIALYWPLAVIGVLAVVLALALPFTIGEPLSGARASPAAYVPSPYLVYPQPSYAPPPPSPPPPAGAPPASSQPDPVPAPPVAPPPPTCPRCGGPLAFVDLYQRWYCPTENLYPWG